MSVLCKSLFLIGQYGGTTIPSVRNCTGVGEESVGSSKEDARLFSAVLVATIAVCVRSALPSFFVSSPCD